MGAFVRALLTVAALVGLSVALWKWAPKYLPEGWRRSNANSPASAPAIYRWKDDQGRTQITDVPPADGRRYERVVIDPQTNVVPKL